MNALTHGAVDLAHEASFRLAHLIVRPPTREVQASDGRSEILEPRVMQVLVALARRRGEVVSRDDLIDACWRGRIVTDDAVNRCVAALRRLAHAHGGLSVETIARVGYRLDEMPDAPVTGEALVAVLPFENLSDEAGMANFSDGVSEEVLQVISRRTDLKVVGRSSSFQCRGAEKALRHVVEHLHATHVLDGAVRRDGAQVRVSAYLIECAGQTTLWSARFDRDLSDVFALQDTVAEAVAAALTEVLGLEAGDTNSCEVSQHTQSSSLGSAA